MYSTITEKKDGVFRYWKEDTNSTQESCFNFDDDHDSDSYGTVTIKEEGLYWIYSQVPKLTSHYSIKLLRCMRNGWRCVIPKRAEFSIDKNTHSEQYGIFDFHHHHNSLIREF